MFCLKHKILFFIALSSFFEIRPFDKLRGTVRKGLIMKIKLFTIPNLLTLGNLFCGCLAVFVTLKFKQHISTLYYLRNSPAIEHYPNDNNLYLSIILGLLGLCLLFDLLDGMVARAMKINSEIGIQLDSLADMVSFGVVPGFLMMTLLLNSVETNSYFQFSGILIILFSALRLAKFNVDTEQSTYFKGLATPANTILIFSLFWIQNQNGFIISKEFDLYFLIGITLISCYLLIANVPLFSFKLKGFAWKDNHYKYVFLIICIILLGIFQVSALPFIILLYIVISII